MMVRPVKNPLFTILFSHGNAVDLGQMSRSVFNLIIHYDTILSSNQCELTIT